MHDMNDLAQAYREADRVVEFVGSFLDQTTSSTPYKRKAGYSKQNTTKRSRSRSRSRSSCSSVSTILTQDREEVLQDMLDRAMDKREDIAVQFFQRLNASMTQDTLPNMIEDLFSYYSAHKRGWKQDMRRDFSSFK